MTDSIKVHAAGHAPRLAGDASSPPLAAADASLDAMRRGRDVLILGSGLTLRLLDRIDTRDWTVLALNRAWQYRPARVDLVVHSDMLPGSMRPSQAEFTGRIFSYSDYRPIVDACAQRWFEAHGEPIVDAAQFLTAHLIHFNASYWAMARLQPRRIAYLGCDFHYTGQTSHYYGKGQAVFAEEPGRAPLAVLFERLQWFADCNEVSLCNLSPEGPTLLPYPRLLSAPWWLPGVGEND